MPWALRGLRDGVVTTGWPRRPDAYADGWPGGVHVLPGTGEPVDPAVERLCPTGAIRRGADDGLVARPGPVHPVRRVRAGPPGPVRLGGRRADRAAAPRSPRRPRAGRRRRGGRDADARRTGSPGARAAPLGAHPPRGHRLGRQRRMGGPRAAQPGLRRRPARHLLHRQPPARRHPAGDRRRRARHGRSAAPHPGGDARARRWSSPPAPTPSAAG